MLRKILSYAKYVIKKELSFFDQMKKKTGIGFYEYYNLVFNNDKNDSSLFGKRIKASDAFWHVHSINELFIDEIYKLKIDKFNPVIVDCGSNVGLSIIYFKKIFPNSKVIGFEPDKVIFDMMRDNLESLGLNDIEIHNKAVWINDDDLMFNASGALGGSIIAEGKLDVTNRISVKAFRLRNLIIDSNIDLLKIDIEGAEFSVLDDCLDVLDNVENIFIEYHRLRGIDQPIGRYLSKLENAGFRLYIKEAWNNLPHPFCYDDYKPMYDLQLNIFGFRK